VWNYALPFLAQKVIDKGYDLPLPYGAGLIYAFNDQQQLLTGLEVGINGRDKAPFQFVSFDKAVTKTDAVNAKVDAWLFPFMNVYATYGPFEADAAIDILIDGDGMLEHLGVSCTGVVRPRLCDRLQSETFCCPFKHSCRHRLECRRRSAGGWHGWFVTIPFNYSRIDLGLTHADGGPIVTVTPRVDALLPSGPGQLRAFRRRQLSQGELEISGTYRVPWRTRN